MCFKQRKSVGSCTSESNRFFPCEVETEHGQVILGDISILPFCCSQTDCGPIKMTANHVIMVVISLLIYCLPRFSCKYHRNCAFSSRRYFPHQYLNIVLLLRIYYRVLLRFGYSNGHKFDTKHLTTSVGKSDAMPQWTITQRTPESNKLVAVSFSDWFLCCHSTVNYWQYWPFINEFDEKRKSSWTFRGIHVASNKYQSNNTPTPDAE